MAKNAKVLYFQSADEAFHALGFGVLGRRGRRNLHEMEELQGDEQRSRPSTSNITHRNGKEVR